MMLSQTREDQFLAPDHMGDTAITIPSSRRHVGAHSGINDALVREGL